MTVENISRGMGVGGGDVGCVSNPQPPDHQSMPTEPLRLAFFSPNLL